MWPQSVVPLGQPAMEASDASSSPSPTASFPSTNVDEELHCHADSLMKNFNSQGASMLYGPASLQSGQAMIVPADQSDPGLQQQSKQAKHEEVHMLAKMADLPLDCIDSWSFDQKMTWLKCMLTLHLPQPEPARLAERVHGLQLVEAEITKAKDDSLEEYINIFAGHFGDSVARKLRAELMEWRRVCDVMSAWKMPPYLPSASGEKVVGDHLWEHILRLLMNQDATVEWLEIEEGLFKFVDSSGAARSWGMTKGNQNMSYEKMSRSIRQYYTEGKTGIIQKAVEFPKLHYRFNMLHPEVVNFLRKNFLAVCQDHLFLSRVVNSVC